MFKSASQISKSLTLLDSSGIRLAVFPIILALIANSSSAVAAKRDTSLQPIKNCATPQIRSGDTCSNVVAEFDFSKCENLAEQQPVKARVICSGHTITLRAAADKLRAEMRYRKVEDGWGSVSWEPMGETLTFQTVQPNSAIRSEKKVTEVLSQAPSIPAAATSTELKEKSEPGRTPAADPTVPSSVSPVNLTVTGFLDMRFASYRSADSAINEKTRSGFLLEDGAIYFSVKKENLEAAIDLPFSRNGLITSDTSDLSLSKTKSQIYGRYHFSKTMHLTFGQFDTVYGFELNDSKDRVFGNVGLAYSQTLPVVHTGTYLSYLENGFTLRALIANPSDRQTFGNDPADSSTEYGGIFGYSNAWMRFQTGFLTRAVANLSNGQSNRTLFDNLLGFTIGQFELDFQYSTAANPRKNTLTAPSNDQEDPGSVAMALVSFQANERLRLSGRFEYLDQDPAGGNFPKAKNIAAAANYNVQDGLTLRAEWVDISVERSTSAAVYDESQWNIGAIVSF